MDNPEVAALRAEARINQLIQRVDSKLRSPVQNQSVDSAKESNRSTPDFKAIATMMQAQMYGQNFFGSNDDNNNSMNFSSNNLNMGMMMMMQQQQMQKFRAGQSSANSLFGFMPTQQVSHSHHNCKHHSSASIPVDGRISSHFNEHGRVHPVTGQVKPHHGVDIAAPMGAPIKAPWDGEVVFVGHADGFGDNTIIVSHPETRQPDGTILYSVFGHNNDTYVEVGQQIGKDQVIGTVGNGGQSTGPHLHWEIRRAEPGLVGKEVFKENLSIAMNPLNFA